jgi:hypothetical protein
MKIELDEAMFDSMKKLRLRCFARDSPLLIESFGNAMKPAEPMPFLMVKMLCTCRYATY